MLLLLMRHGSAEALTLEKWDDFNRALTPKGRKRAREVALGLRNLAPKIDFLATSPKVRACETAEIVRDVYGNAALPLFFWDKLMDENFTEWRGKLRDLDAETALLCGHEPILGRMVAQLLTGAAEGFAVDFKKAGVCALEIEFEPFEAILKWHLTPKQLAALAG